MSDVDANRRAFLRGALLTREGRAEQARLQKPLGPPPPWHQGQALASLCAGCAQPCVTACEQRIIRIHPNNHRLAGIPYLDFSATGCTFCRACVEICPLDIAIGARAAPVAGRPVLDRNTCIAWRDIICMSCTSRCGYRAITTQHNRRPKIDPKACTGCGMCVAACPVQALSVV